MILVDTSIWIKLLAKDSTLRLTKEQLQQVATCPIIIQEVFQGLRLGSESKDFKDRFLALPRFGDPTPLPSYLEAAEIYASARRRGITVRSSADCLIASIALENDVLVWHKDRDFSEIAKFTNLRERREF